MVAGPSMPVWVECASGTAPGALQPALTLSQPSLAWGPDRTCWSPPAAPESCSDHRHQLELHPGPQRAHGGQSLKKPVSAQRSGWTTRQLNYSDMQRVQQRPGALAAPARPARPGLRAAPRPVQLAGAPAQRSSTQMQRRERVHKQSGRR